MLRPHVLQFQHAAEIAAVALQSAWRGFRIRRVLNPHLPPQEAVKLVFALRQRESEAVGLRRHSNHLLHIVEALRKEVRRVSVDQVSPPTTPARTPATSTSVSRAEHENVVAKLSTRSALLAKSQRSTVESLRRRLEMYEEGHSQHSVRAARALDVLLAGALDGVDDERDGSASPSAQRSSSVRRNSAGESEVETLRQLVVAAESRAHELSQRFAAAVAQRDAARGDLLSARSTHTSEITKQQQLVDLR
jgi:hypothetical protein